MRADCARRLTPVEITATIEAFKSVYPWVVQAPGPGPGIQMTNGRLVVSFNLEWLTGGQESLERGDLPLNRLGGG